MKDRYVTACSANEFLSEHKDHMGFRANLMPDEAGLMRMYCCGLRWSGENAILGVVEKWT